MPNAINPVVRGFAPDPSAIRVGGWFYLATSSFEWYPTIPIRRSRDLVHWQYVGSVGGAVPEGNLFGVSDSAGIWAPSLSHDGERFWVTYSIVRTFLGRQLDVDTYISTAQSAAGPWTAPRRVSSHGFDPSIFHHDGRHYLLNVQSDSRPGGNRFSGILIVELDAEGTRTVGTPTLLLQHPTLMEGPKVLVRDGWFYLVMAQGGTGVEHGVMMARSRHLIGLYELDSQPLLTSRDDSTLRLQKAGHSEFLEDPDGRWFISHLASRWIDTLQGRQYPWGRETCFQEIEWVDGWPRLIHGGWHPADVLHAPAGPAVIEGSDHADQAPGWPWRTLREPVGDWAGSVEGGMRLRGRHDLESMFGLSMLAQPLQEPVVRFAATVDACPTTFTQSAGMVLWYNSTSYYSLALTWREPWGEGQHGQQWVGRGDRVFALTGRDRGEARVLDVGVLDNDEPVRLEAYIEGNSAWFSVNGRVVGPSLDMGILSDDYGGSLRFTGSMAGIFVVDQVDGSFTATFTDIHLQQDGER